MSQRTKGTAEAVTDMEISEADFCAHPGRDRIGTSTGRGRGLAGAVVEPTGDVGAARQSRSSPFMPAGAGSCEKSTNPSWSAVVFAVGEWLRA